MTCGINLGFLLICCLQALHGCCSGAFHDGKGSWTDNTDSRVDWRVHGGFESSSPQGQFRRVYVVKDSSADTRAKHGLHSEKYPSRASLKPPVQYLNSLSSLMWYNVDSSNRNVPQVSGQSSVSDSSNQYSGGFRTLPEQQGTQRTGQYAPSSPDVHQFSSWKPHSSDKVHQKPNLSASSQLTGLNGKGGVKPLKEYTSETSGRVRGTRVDPKDSSSNPYNNPVISNIRDRYENPISLHFGLNQAHQHQGSAYNQNPQLVSLHTGLSHASVPTEERELQRQQLKPGEKFAPTVVYNIPMRYGGHPIKRLGEEDEEPMEQTTTTPIPKKPVTPQPTQKYTFQSRPTEPYRPRQTKVHKKSKWVMVKSNLLMGDGYF